MNPFKLIAAFFKIKQEATIMDKIKSGYLTSEFWATMIPLVVSIWGQASGFIPQPYATYIQIGAVGIYTIARTVLKAIHDIQAAKAMTAIAATHAA